MDLDAPGALAEVHRRLALDESRNARITDDVVAALAPGHNCLVLTRRVADFEALTALLLTRRHQALVLQGAMSATNRRTLVGRLDRAKTGDRLLVIGTTPFIGEGFDAPAFDTLFLAGPISYDGLLIQCAGRIIRDPRRDVVEIHDYHDQPHESDGFGLRIGRFRVRVPALAGISMSRPKSCVEHPAQARRRRPGAGGGPGTGRGLHRPG
ncbi:helicase-related protein [Micromonospora sp. NPDC003776]